MTGYMVDNISGAHVLPRAVLPGMVAAIAEIINVGSTAGVAITGATLWRYKAFVEQFTRISGLIYWKRVRPLALPGMAKLNFNGSL